MSAAFSALIPGKSHLPKVHSDHRDMPVASPKLCTAPGGRRSTGAGHGSGAAGTAPHCHFSTEDQAVPTLNGSSTPGHFAEWARITIFFIINNNILLVVI